MSDILLTAYPGSILGPIAKLLGILMDWIYSGISNITGGRVESVVLSIVIITIIIYMCLLPLTIKQQKFSKLSQKMQPEMQAIQAKYKNKKDQASMMAMQEETQLLYQKYGISPMGSCVQMLIQMPILFALYQVIYHIPGYIGSVRNVFQVLTTQMMGVSGYSDILTQFITDNRVTMYSKVSETLTENNLLDMFYVLKPSQWTKLADISEFSGIADTITKTAAESICSSDCRSNSGAGSGMVYPVAELQADAAGTIFQQRK